MVVYKQWCARREWKHGGIKDEWRREGWFLFGFIPLYIRDVGLRAEF